LLEGRGGMMERRSELWAREIGEKGRREKKKQAAESGDR